MSGQPIEDLGNILRRFWEGDAGSVVPSRARQLHSTRIGALATRRKDEKMSSSLFRRGTIACGGAAVAVAGVTMLGVPRAAQASTAPAARAATMTTGAIH